jgi:hypothetical protein
MRSCPRRFAALAIVASLAVGCQPNAACEETSVSLEATVSDTAMEPSALTVCRDQDVTLVLTSETDGVLHIHGYDDQVPAVTLESGDVMDIEFTADVVGQFIIELHAHAGDTSAEIGVLTVDEP